MITAAPDPLSDAWELKTRDWRRTLRQAFLTPLSLRKARLGWRCQNRPVLTSADGRKGRLKSQGVPDLTIHWFYGRLRSCKKGVLTTARSPLTAICPFTNTRPSTSPPTPVAIVPREAETRAVLALCRSLVCRQLHQGPQRGAGCAQQKGFCISSHLADWAGSCRVRQKSH